MNERLDDLLRSAGRSYAGAPPDRGPRPDDVERRGRARRRAQRTTAGGLAALVLVAGAAALARPNHDAFQDVRSGQPDHAAPATATPTTVPDPGPPAPPATGAPPPSAPSTAAVTPTSRPATSSTTPTAPAAVRGVHDVDFRAMTYPADSCGLSDGGRLTVWDRQGTPELGQVDVRVSYGDLDGDTRDEAVVVVECLGGAHSSYNGWVYTAGPAGVRRGPAIVPDASMRQSLAASPHAIVGFILNGATAEGTTVTSTWRGLRAEEADCCPSFLVHLSQHLVGSELVGTVTEIEPVSEPPG
jgi:hypothetical protein